MKQDLKAAFKKLLISAVYLASVLLLVSFVDWLTKSKTATGAAFVVYSILLFCVPDTWIDKLIKWVDQ